MLRRATAVVLTLALLAAHVPAGAQVVSAPRPAAGASSWAGAGLAEFQSPRTPGDWRPTPLLVQEALGRVLALSPSLQAAPLEQALGARAAELSLRLEAAKPERGSAEGVQAYHRLRREALDALLALEGAELPPARKAELSRALEAVRSSAEERGRRESRALLERVSGRLLTEARRVGRTLVLPLEDGSILAVKREDSPEHEAAMTARAEVFGLTAPLVLPAEGWGVRVGEESIRALPYLVPGEHARDYFAYLGSTLDDPAEDRGAAVRGAALRSIEQLALLEKHGHGHSSLAALSHSKGDWRWDYWRVNQPVVSPLRFGPTSIHDWLAALSFPNMRLSGLADFEHVDPWDARRDAPGGRTRVFGQNLTEWSLATLRAARNNGFSPDEAARLVSDGLWSWAGAFAPEARAGADRKALERSVAASTRRFYGFSRVNEALPQFGRDILNFVVSLVSVGWQPRGAALTMPGGVVHSLIMGAILPLAESAGGTGASAGLRVRGEEVVLALIGVLFSATVTYTLLAAVLPVGLALQLGGAWLAMGTARYVLWDRPRLAKRPWIGRP